MSDGGPRLGMVAVTEDNHLIPLVLKLLGDLLHHGDDGAGGIEDIETETLSTRKCRGTFAVRSHQDGAAGQWRRLFHWEVIIHEGDREGSHAHRLQLLHGRCVMDQLARDKDLLVRTVLGGLYGELPRPLDPATKPDKPIPSNYAHRFPSNRASHP